MPADRDFELNYGGCIVYYQDDYYGPGSGRCYHVNVDGDRSFHLSRPGHTEKVAIDDPKLHFRWPELGAINVQGRAIYLSRRIRGRNYRRLLRDGVCTHHTYTATASTETPDRRGLIDLDTYAQLFVPDYPEPAFAMWQLRRGNIESVALSRRIVLVPKNKKSVSVFSGLWRVGVCDNENPLTFTPNNDISQSWATAVMSELQEIVNEKTEQDVRASA